jgi:hypothetical protein
MNPRMILKHGFPLKPVQPYPKKVEPMKLLQGPWAIIEHSCSIGPDTPSIYGHVLKDRPERAPSCQRGGGRSQGAQYE